MMKRVKPSEFTLWRAAVVNKTSTLHQWLEGVEFKSLCSPSQGAGMTLSDFPPFKKSKEKVMSVFVAGLKPTPKQRAELNKHLKVAQASYNWCKWLVQEMGVQPTQFQLQKYVAKNCTAPRLRGGKVVEPLDPKMIMPGCEWIVGTSTTQTRLLAAKDFSTVHRTVSKKACQNKKPCVIKDRRVGTLKGSFGCQKQFVKVLQSDQISILPKSIGTLKVTTRHLPPINHDLRVVKLPGGKWRLHIPVEASFLRRPLPPSQKLCGIDPGARAMITVYDETDHHAWQACSHRNRQELQPLLKIAKTSTEQKTRLIAWQKIRNKVNGWHRQLINKLVKDFAHIAVGDLSVQSVVSRKRSLHRSVKDTLHLWGHFKFHTRLLHRVKGTNRRVVVQNEYLTSKTCSECFEINKNLGSNETFACKSCRYLTNRDVNAAKNILRNSLLP